MGRLPFGADSRGINNDVAAGADVDNGTQSFAEKPQKFTEKREKKSVSYFHLFAGAPWRVLSPLSSKYPCKCKLIQQNG